MRMKYHHTPYVARRISRDLATCEFVEVRKTKDEITAEIEKILVADLEKEHDLDEKVNDILDEQEDNIEFYNADYRQLFWMTKKNTYISMQGQIGTVSSTDICEAQKELT